MGLGPAVASRVLRSPRNTFDRFTLGAAHDRPIFLGGCPRSGTTLLRTMVHSHPDVGIPRETRFVLDAFRNRRTFGDLREPLNRRKLAEWVVQERSTRFHRLKVDPVEAVERLAAAPPTIGSVVGTGLIMYAERHGATRWGDKRPGNVQHLPLLFALFPDMHFLNIVRDPRSVVASMKKLGWVDEWYGGRISGAIMRWLRSVADGRRAARRYRSDQFFELRYEDLVADPERWLLDICRFAGLSEEHLGSMLNYHVSADEIPKRMKGKYHPLLDKPLTTEAMRSWTTTLSEGEVALIESATARQMRRYGYELTTRDAPVPLELEREWRKAQRGEQTERTLARALPAFFAYPYPVAARLTTAQCRRARLLGFRRLT